MSTPFPPGLKGQYCHDQQGMESVLVLDLTQWLLPQIRSYYHVVAAQKIQ